MGKQPYNLSSSSFRHQELLSSLAALKFRQESGEFNEQLRKVCWHTLLVLEFLTARHLDLAAYHRMLEEFSRCDYLCIGRKLAESRFSIIASVSRSN